MKSDSPQQQYQQQKRQASITVSTLTSYAQQLAQSIEQNTNLRMKHPESPQRFYPTQEQIHTILSTLSESLSQQDIPSLIESHISQPMLRLLTHPNVDLSLLVVEILYELLQEEPQDDKLFEIYYRWVVWMVDNSCVEAVVGLLTKIDEENDIEEYETGLKCIKLIQIFINVTETTYQILAQDKQLFEYLANRIMPNFIVKHKIIDDNKYASSDILISLLSNSEKSQHLFSHFSGVEVLLETIASYQSKLPTNQDQKQFLSNLFSSLSILLMNFLLPLNKKTYCEMKGNYLMISFVKMKNQYSAMALKCIANSLVGLNREDQQQAVASIVNDGGLKYLFAVVRRKGVRGQDVDEQKAIDENCVNIVYSMVRSLSDVFKDRLEYKLAENRFENLERLVEMRGEYWQAVEAVGDEEEGREEEKQPHDNQREQQKKQSSYLTKLSEGLALVQTIDKTLLITVQKYAKLRQKLTSLFKLYNITYSQLEQTLKAHYEYIGVKEQKAFVEMLLGNNLRLAKKLFDKMEQEKDGRQQKEIKKEEK